MTVGIRTRGAVAGLLPASAVGLLFVISGSGTATPDVAVSLGLVAVIAMTAGWIAGPLVAGRTVMLPAATFGYAIAVIAATAGLSATQAGWDAATTRGSDPIAIAVAIVVRLGYGLISSVYLLVPALATGLVWSLAARALVRGTRADPDQRGTSGGPDGGGGGDDDAPPNLTPRRDPRRLGLAAAGIIAGYSVVVAAISAGLIANLASPGPEPSGAIPRPIVLGAVLMLPAAIACIGAVRRTRPILAAAGIICFAQSFIAFSGVTIPFLVPAILLIALAGEDAGSGLTSSGRVVMGGALVVVLGIATWIAPFALTEQRCWVSRVGPDGTLIYSDAPTSDSVTLEPDEVGGGCDSGSLTIQGEGLAAVFGVGAVAVAALASMPSKRRRPLTGAVA